MSVLVRIPTVLEKLTKGQLEIKADGITIAELMDDLEKNYPGFKDRICSEDGKIRRTVNIFINENDIRFIQAEISPIKEGDEISIIPAFSGGVMAQEKGKNG